MKYILFLPIIALFFSCGNSKEVNQNNTTEKKSMTKKPPEVVPTQQNYMLKSTIGDFKKTDAFNIKKLSISGNTLLLTITYTGGCAEHSFEFIGSPMIMKSMPPIRSVQLIHNANNDACKKIVTNTIEIDLTTIAYSPAKGSELMLMLKGWDEKIKYTYE